jgi:hypothetical protein
MRKLMTLSACLLTIAGTSASAAAAAAAGKAVDPARATCDARYYGYLVGKGIEEARNINGTYRVVDAGAPRGDTNAKRMTITVNPKSGTITDVSCG